MRTGQHDESESLAGATGRQGGHDRLLVADLLGPGIDDEAGDLATEPMSPGTSR